MKDDKLPSLNELPVSPSQYFQSDLLVPFFLEQERPKSFPRRILETPKTIHFNIGDGALRGPFKF